MNRNARKARQSAAASPPPSKTRRYLLLGIVAVAIAGVVAYGAAYFTSEPPPTAPDIAVEGLPPAVQGIITSAQDIVRQNPYSSEAWGQLGMILMAHRIEDDARTCLRQAAALDEKEFRWPYLLGVSLAVAKPEIAREHFQQAISLNPRSSIAHCRLAELDLARNRLDASDKNLKKATELDRGNARAWLGRARVAFAREQYDTSLEHARKSVELAESERAPHAMLAMIYQALDDRAKATHHLRIAQELPDQTLLWQDPVAGEVLQFRQDAEGAIATAEHLAAEGNLAEAVETLDQAIRMNPADPRPHAKLAALLVDHQNLPGAAFALDRALEQHQNSASLQFQRGVVHFLQDEYAAAEVHFQSAILAKPDHALAHYNLGHTYLKQNKSAAATEAFQSAVRLQPSHAEAHINLARLLLAEGKTATAREHLQIAQQLKPEDPQLLDLLRQAGPGR